MKITFQTTEENISSKLHTSAREAGTEVRRIGSQKSYILDLSAGGGQNQIYEQQGRRTKDIMQEMQTKDVSMTRNYMAVMSNCMSDGDFARLQKDGYDVGSMKVDETVTIVDKIKASLLEAGVSVSGYTDTIDMDTLTEITGSQALAQDMKNAFKEQGAPLTEETAKKAMQALSEAQELKEPTQETKNYMVKYGMEPTLSSLYLAQYSSGSETGSYQGGYYREENGYLTRQPGELSMESLLPQIEKIAKEAGIADLEKAQEAAQKMLGNGIPLTEETLRAYLKMDEMKIPGQYDLFDAMAAAVLDGREPKDADLTGNASIWEQAKELWERTQSLSDGAADLAAADGETLTLEKLSAAQLLLDSGYQNIKGENIAARRQLEEVRLQMTIEANRVLLQSGYAIETRELEQVVDALKEAEDSYNRILFGGETIEENAQRAQCYNEAVETAAQLPYLPAAVSGKVAFADNDINLKQIKTEGENLAQQYQKAEKQYETLGTAPRRDLGDSIKKAFENTDMDGILEELSMESTASNKRAVRILGYNGMEITKENIETVRAADSELQTVIRKMTPAAVLKMIREGKNPLEMTAAELSEYFEQNGETKQEEQEKYARYLYKLEQHGEISKEEKESYIGIYRLLRQVEKTDGAVIGQLIGQGAELSFGNLLSAVRTRRTGSLELTADGETGVQSQVISSGKRIDEQIQTAFYQDLAKEAYERMDADKVVEIAPTLETELEPFTEQLRMLDGAENGEKDAAYQKEQAVRCHAAAQAKDSAISLLTQLEEPVTIENVLAAEEYQKDLAQTFKKIRKEADTYFEKAKDSFAGTLSELEKAFTDAKEPEEAYRQLTETEKEILENAMYENQEISYLDLRELGLAYKQVGFMAHLARQQEAYEIPLLMEDSVTALHLRIVHSDEEKGGVEASMEIGQEKRISIKLQVQANEVTGVLVASSEESGAFLAAVREDLEAAVSELGLTAKELQTGFREDLKENFTQKTAQGREQMEISTKTLYRVAGTVIGAVRRQMERS